MIFITSCSEDTVSFTGVGKITGRVVEAENFNPIENAKVVLTPTNNTVFTDSDGYFVFEEVEAGDYSVNATKEGFLTNFQPATVTIGLEVNVVFEMDVETAGNRPPSTPKLISPEDLASKIDLAVELVWSSKDPENDTITFKIKIKNDRNNDIQLIENLLDSTYVLSNLTNGTKYFWEVSATDNINDEVWSTVSSFETTQVTNNRYLYVRQENGNNVIYSSDENGNESSLTPNSISSWRPRKNLATNKIAFLRFDNFETQLYTMNADGSDVFKVTSLSVNGFKQSELDFSWSANGAKLIYPHYDKLYEINKDGSGLRLIHQTSDGSFISECDWSNDESTIAIKTNNTNGYNVSIYTINMAGNKLQTILSGVNGAAGGINLSIDNKMLLYTYDVSGFESSNYRQLDSRMFIYYFDTDNKVDISEEKINGTVDLDPRFSPSEAEVIFVNTSNDGISQRNIFTQTIDKNNLTGGNNYNREEKFTDATMPDWE
jgi:Carboxypeptidase regulatory-like domain